VHRGDTLGKISKRFGVSEDAIVALNGLRNRHQIHTGQILHIPGDGHAPAAPGEPAVAKPVETATSPANAATQPAGQRRPNGGTAPGTLPLSSERYAVAPGGTVEVQPGETLGHFADWLEVPTSSLRHRNHLEFGAPLVIGTRLSLDFSRVPAERFQERRVAHHRALQSAFYGTYEIAGTEVYVLKRGDSLWKLSRGSQPIPVWLLREYNPDLDLGSLRAGQRLTIPKIAKRRG
jgi:membrane-bound lytic murein transglycosylase D